MSGGLAVEAMVPPLEVVICPRGFFKHSLVWRAPVDPVAGHILGEGLQYDSSLVLEAVKHYDK